MKIKNTNRNVYIVLVALLEKLLGATTDASRDAIMDYLLPDKKIEIPFKEVVFDLSIMIKLLNEELPEKSYEHLGVFFTLLTIMSLSKVVTTKDLVSFLEVVCRNNNYVLEDVLKGFFDSYAFYSDLFESTEIDCEKCQNCIEEEKEEKINTNLN